MIMHEGRNLVKTRTGYRNINPTREAIRNGSDLSESFFSPTTVELRNGNANVGKQGGRSLYLFETTT